jgi:hypothetical protein
LPRIARIGANGLLTGSAGGQDFVAWYNFSRKHEALKGQTPAMASGLTDHVWTINQLVERAAA